MSTLVHLSAASQRGTIPGGGTAHVRKRRGGALHEQCKRHAQLAQPLISGTTCRPETAGQRRLQHGAATGTVSRIRCDIGSFPHGSAGSAVSRLKARLAATRPTWSPVPLLANTTQRRRRGSRRKLKGSNTMAYQTVNPYDNHVLATFDDLTDQQVTQLLAQAQNTFESWIKEQ
jgi:hypothetical protein